MVEEDWQFVVSVADLKPASLLALDDDSGQPEQSGIADQCGLRPTRADQAIGSRKGQTLSADSILKRNAELSFEHLPHPLAEGELIDLRFDGRLLAAQYACHKANRSRSVMRATRIKRFSPLPS